MFRPHRTAVNLVSCALGFVIGEGSHRARGTVAAEQARPISGLKRAADRDPNGAKPQCRNLEVSGKSAGFDSGYMT